jgi:hypothetical protein
MEINKKEFINFVMDHIKHFNAIPLEFEDSSGNEIGSDQCWKLAVHLNLIKNLNWETDGETCEQ